MPDTGLLDEASVQALAHQASYTLDTMSGRDLMVLVKMGRHAEWGDWVQWAEISELLYITPLVQHNVIIIDGKMARLTLLGGAVLRAFARHTGAE